MDILGNHKMRRIVTKYYEESGEPKLVRKAVCKAREEEEKLINSTYKRSKFETLRCV